MAIWRGVGGSGESTNDSTVPTVTALLVDAEAARDAAQLAETNAETAASNAASSASTASTQASNATTSATNAASSASAASTSATNAASSASTASTQASNAASSASAASTSASNAASSASSAASSASTATTKASEASTSATNAASSATAAASSASSAATQAGNAASSASAASTSASNASTSASNAASSASAAAASYDSFDDRYLGAKSSAPTLDNDGNALLTGALYFNTSTNEMKVWSGSAWLNAYASLSGALLATNNLSDLNNVATARTNLGLGTAATQNSTAFATAAQGTNADTAYGWGNHALAGYAADSAVVKLTGNQTIAGTKTFSSNPILSAGTANGVLYLNGSKVATSGSALTFDGTNLGVGTSSPADILHLSKAGDLYLRISNTSTGINAYFGQDSNGTYIGNTGASVVRFIQGASERMRIDTSGNLGIGTSSPSYKLDVVANQNASTISSVSNSTSGTAAYAALRISSDTNSWLYNFSSGYTTSGRFAAGTTLLDVGGSNGLGLSTSGSAPIIFYTVGSERMRLDSSGNLGLGVTPSAWVSTFKAFQVGTGGTFYGDYNNTTSYFGNNAYFNGSAWKYVSSSYALYAYQDRSAGKHVWAVAASGTAGNNITWTEALTLDASGNLLLGTTSSDARLNIKGSGSTSSTFSLIVRNSASGDIVKTRDDGFVFLPSTYNNTSASAANVFMGGSGELYRSTSSLKYKTNVQDAEHGLADLLKLRSVTYEGKSENDAGKTFGGLIAEEVHAAGLTEFVQYAEDGTPDALAYGNMVSLCIKAIQEQQAIIESLKADVAALKGA